MVTRNETDGASIRYVRRRTVESTKQNSEDKAYGWWTNRNKQNIQAIHPQHPPSVGHNFVSMNDNTKRYFITPLHAHFHFTSYICLLSRPLTNVCTNTNQITIAGQYVGPKWQRTMDGWTVTCRTSDLLSTHSIWPAIVIDLAICHVRVKCAATATNKQQQQQYKMHASRYSDSEYSPKGEWLLEYGFF